MVSPSESFLTSMMALAKYYKSIDNKQFCKKNIVTTDEYMQYQQDLDVSKNPWTLYRDAVAAFTEKNIFFKKAELFKVGSFSIIFKVNYEYIKSESIQKGKGILEIPRYESEMSGHSKRKNRISAVGSNIHWFQYYEQKNLQLYLPKPIASTSILLSNKSSVPVSLHEFFLNSEELGIGDTGLVTWHADKDNQIRTTNLEFKEAGDILAEVVACLIYHSEINDNGWTVPTNFYFANGDCILLLDSNGSISRRQDGTPDIRLITMRDRVKKISSKQLLSSLESLTTLADLREDKYRYKDVGESFVWRCPVRISNASVACEGLFRGIVKGHGHTIEQAIQGVGKLINESELINKEEWLEWYYKAIIGRTSLRGKIPLFGLHSGEGRISIFDCLQAGLQLMDEGAEIISHHFEMNSDKMNMDRLIAEYRGVEQEIIRRAIILLQREGYT